VGAQEVRWESVGPEPAEYTFSCRMENETHELGTGLSKRIISAVKKVEFFSDRMSYITLRGSWYDIILNIHAPTEDTIDDMKDNFYEELEKSIP
jgi:hypothetical protein